MITMMTMRQARMNTVMMTPTTTVEVKLNAEAAEKSETVYL